MKIRPVLLILSCLPSCLSHALTMTEPLNGWTFDFPSAIEKANAEHRPLLIATYSPYCGYCSRVRKAFSTETFRKWADSRNVILVESYTALTNDSPAQAAALNFVRASPFLGPHELPYVTYYRPAFSTNEELRAVFPGRRDKAPGKGGEKLEDVLINACLALDTPEIRDRVKRISEVERQIAHPPSKRIVAVAEGPGKVVMSPSTGELSKGGKVEISAVPNEGAAFDHWKDSRGNRIKWRISPSLTLRFGAKSGTYTAVFRETGK